MRIADKWQDYELIDCSDGDRLERWGETILIRPDPQVIWKTEKKNPLWRHANGQSLRSRTGGGHWTLFKNVPGYWSVRYGEMEFNIKTMGFKHTGLFPEQAVNWDRTMEILGGADKELRVLNLFAYTGGATVAALKAGASVVHVDAARGMVQWAKDNAVRSGVADRPVRWIVDDCIKFVEREIRRGNRYDAIIMDPPSYGRGPNGEVWKLEDKVYDLITQSIRLLSDDARMLLINSYTTGLAPSVMAYILGSTLVPERGGTVESDEIGLPVTETGMVLPCGASAFWLQK